MRPVCRALARSAPDRVPYGPPLSVTATEGGTRLDSGEPPSIERRPGATRRRRRPRSGAAHGGQRPERPRHDHARHGPGRQRLSASAPASSTFSHPDCNRRLRPRTGICDPHMGRSRARRVCRATRAPYRRSGITPCPEGQPIDSVDELLVARCPSHYRSARRSRATSPPHCNHTARSRDSPRACRTSGAPSPRRRSGQRRSA